MRDNPRLAKVLPAALAAGLALASTAARAADFLLVNRTSEAVLSFQVAPRGGGSWSRNWLRAPLQPGDALPMTFRFADHDCWVSNRIVMESGATFMDGGNICAVSRLFVRWVGGRLRLTDY